MPRTRSARTTMAGGLAILAALGGAVVSAPAAHAETAAHCATGTAINYSSHVLIGNCSPFTDNGAPYVFQVDTFTFVFIAWLPGHPSRVTRYDVTVTCGDYTVDDDGRIRPTGCTTW